MVEAVLLFMETHRFKAVDADADVVLDEARPAFFLSQNLAKALCEHFQLRSFQYMIYL